MEKSIDEITIQDVHELVDNEIFGRGSEYFRDGAVIEPAYDGNRIYAQVEGSSNSNYRTSVKLERNRLKCECSCPYEWGTCKHVVALLLHWIRKRKDFNDAGSRRLKITQMSRTELVKIINIFAKEEPELFLKIIDYAFPEGLEGNIAAPDFAKKAEKTLKEGGSYYDTPGILQQLEACRKHIKLRLKSKQYGYVAQQLSSLAGSCIKNYGLFDDSNGRLYEFVDTCFSEIRHIWIHIDEDTRILLIRGIYEIQYEDDGFEETVENLLIRICKTQKERDCIRKPIIQKLVSLEERGGKDSKNSNHYDYKRIFGLALYLGYINKHGVYIHE